MLHLVDVEPREVWQYLRSVQLIAGEAWECGVFRGDTSVMLAKVAGLRTLRLFDTFTGRPAKMAQDTGSSESAFTDTSLDAVQQLVPDAICHAGLIPETFAGLEDARIAFAYLDLDLYQGTYDALTFVLPRLVPGGVIVVDDYLEPVVWPGVRVAVDALVPSVTTQGKRAIIRG